MKKFVVFIIFTFLFFPTCVFADKITTKIVGIDKVQPTETIVYTVIVDRPLTGYTASITYNRDELNLVSVEEVNINTTTKDFKYEKNNPIVISSKSDESSMIIYTITFNVKKYFKSDSTDITLNTKLAKNGSEVYDSVETVKRVSIIEEDPVFTEDEEEKPNELSKTLTSISKVIKKFDNPIMIVSISLNVVLFALLITSIRRKKVDYDF